jgi:hypothetical protein
LHELRNVTGIPRKSGHVRRLCATAEADSRFCSNTSAELRFWLELTGDSKLQFRRGNLDV